MAVFRDEVIVLRARDLGEADRMYGLFGKRRGRFTAVANGVRKMASRKRGHLQTYNICKVSCAEGRSMDVLLEAESLFVLDPDFLDAEQFELIGFAAMVVDRFLPEGVPDKLVFEEWVEFVNGEIGELETKRVISEILMRQGVLRQEVYDQICQDPGWPMAKVRRYVDSVLDTA